MKILLLRVILACSLLSQPVSTWASEPQFDETIDKLILITNGQRRYLDNCTQLMKENDPEAQNYIANFLLPNGGNMFKAKNALIDFYVDRIYTEIIEKSLGKLKTLYKSKNVNQELNSPELQNALTRMVKNLLRATAIGASDVVSHAQGYFSSIDPVFKVTFSTKQQIGYECNLKNERVVKGLTLLKPMCDGIPAHYTTEKYISEFYDFFQENTVVVHYYKQALKYAEIARTLNVFLNDNSQLQNNKYSGTAGTQASILDEVADIITKQNIGFLTMINLDEAQKQEPIIPRQERQLAELKKIQKNNETIVFLKNETAFIQKQVDTIFKYDGWGSNANMNQWKKNQSKQKKPTPKSKTKPSANKKSVLLPPVPKPEIPRPSYTPKQLMDFWFLQQWFPNQKDIIQNCLWFCEYGILPIKNNIVEEDATFIFEDWYRDNVTAYQAKKQLPVTNNNSSKTVGAALSIPVFTKDGADFITVVLGGGYQEITVKHFNTFLKQAGGAKVKMTQGGYVPIQMNDKSVETTYMLPNLNENWEATPFLLCHVHQPHSASDPFPKKTLYNFFKRDLMSAGYTKEKLGF